MSILLFAENAQGEFKKPVFEAATYAADLAAKLGTHAEAVSVGQVSQSELEKLGTYGISKVHVVSHPDLGHFVNTAYAAAVTAVAQAVKAKAVIVPQTYNGRAIAARVTAKLGASPLVGVVGLVDPAQNFQVRRTTYSGKGMQDLTPTRDVMVISPKLNSYHTAENPVAVSIEPFAFTPHTGDIDTVVKEIVKASEGISLTEADNVVSAGRGMKGPENWGMIEELAGLLHAATACSKPTADMGWRPHHEHVGQTGIQIAPNLYIAIGISGAIQHLAGVSSSKNIVVINSDPEAPFFKIADYGVVGDLFEVVPKLIQAVKQVKAA